MTSRRIMVLCLSLVALGCDGEEPEAAETDLVQQAATAARRCAGPNELRCPTGQYCKSAVAGQCPGKRTYGVCAGRPQVCTTMYDPVCGCNGKTYGNACQAAAASTSIKHDGACPTDDPCSSVTCPPQNRCLVQEGKPVCTPLPGESCGQVVCPAGEVCCNSSCGICVPPGGVCIQMFCDPSR